MSGGDVLSSHFLIGPYIFMPMLLVFTTEPAEFLSAKIFKYFKFLKWLLTWIT